MDTRNNAILDFSIENYFDFSPKKMQNYSINKMYELKSLACFLV